MTATVKIVGIIQSMPQKYYSEGVKGSKSAQTSYAQREEQHFHIISTPVRYTKHTCMITHAQTPAITLAPTRLPAPLLFTHIYTHKIPTGAQRAKKLSLP